MALSLEFDPKAKKRDPMEMQRLREAMMSNQMSKGKLANLAPQRERAKELRSASSTPDAYGVGALGDILQNISGMQQDRNLDKQVAQQAPIQARASGLADQEGLRRALSKEDDTNAQTTRDVNQTRINARDSDTQAGNLRVSQGRLGLDRSIEDRNARKLGSGEFEGQYKDGNGKLHTVYAGPNGEPTLDGTTPLGVIPDDWKFQKHDGRSSTRIMSGKDRTSLDEGKNVYTALSELAGDFRPEHVQPANIPTSLAGATFQMIADQGLDGVIAKFMPGIGKEEFAKVKASMEWQAKWASSYGLVMRNETFGATLTPAELKAWKDAMQMNIGSDPKLFERRMRNLVQTYQHQYSEKLNGLAVEENFRPVTDNYGRDIYKGEDGRYGVENYKPFSTTYWAEAERIEKGEVPSWVTKDELPMWNSLDMSDRLAYLERREIE